MFYCINGESFIGFEFYIHWRKLLMLRYEMGKGKGHIFLRLYHIFVPITTVVKV